MEIIKSSHSILPLDIDPLQRIELIGKVCTKKENTINSDSSNKFFKRRIQDGHCAIAEHGVVYFRIESNDIYCDRIVNIMNEFKYIHYKRDSYNLNIFHISFNYRVLIDYYNNILNPKIRYSDDADNFMKYVNKTVDIAYTIYDELVASKIQELIDYSFNVKSTEYRMIKISESECAIFEPSIVQLSIKFITDRGVSHELVRHKTLSFMQESTRWCKYDKGIVFIKPYWMSDTEFDIINNNNHIDDTTTFSYIEESIINNLSTAAIAFIRQCSATERNYATLLCSTKQAQAARAVLGQCVKTEIWITAPLYLIEGYICPIEFGIKEKKGLLPQRTASDAHPDMQDLMKDVSQSIKDVMTSI